LWQALAFSICLGCGGRLALLESSTGGDDAASPPGPVTVDASTEQRDASMLASPDASAAVDASTIMGDGSFLDAAPLEAASDATSADGSLAAVSDASSSADSSLAGLLSCTTGAPCPGISQIATCDAGYVGHGCELSCFCQEGNTVYCELGCP
jgi:hypothetical protein